MAQSLSLFGMATIIVLATLHAWGQCVRCSGIRSRGPASVEGIEVAHMPTEVGTLPRYHTGIMPPASGVWCRK
jgi:hypothetical protein